MFGSLHRLQHTFWKLLVDEGGEAHVHATRWDQLVSQIMDFWACAVRGSRT